MSMSECLTMELPENFSDNNNNNCRSSIYLTANLTNIAEGVVTIPQKFDRTCSSRICRENAWQTIQGRDVFFFFSFIPTFFFS